MKRTTTRRRREMQHFITENRRLFPFAGLFLAGVALGVAVYLTLIPATSPLGDLLRLSPVSEGIAGFFTTWVRHGFAAVGLLAVLYLLGLWACGGPFVLLVPLFYGLGIGMTEGFYYAMGRSGVLTVAVLVMPYALLSATVLIMAASESLRLSTGLSRALLPAAGQEGDLWHHFRLYSLRYLLFAAAAVGISGLDILLRRLMSGLLSGN